MLERGGCPNCSSDLVFTESDAATSDPAVAVALEAAGAWVQNAALQAAAAKARQLLVMAAGQEQHVHMRTMEADAAKAEAEAQLREREERRQIASDLREIKRRLS
jgi:hypothetical protein